MNVVIAKVAFGILTAGAVAVAGPMAFAGDGGTTTTPTVTAPTKGDDKGGCENRNERADRKGDNRSATGKEHAKDAETKSKGHRSAKSKMTCAERMAAKAAKKAAHDTKMAAKKAARDARKAAHAAEKATKSTEKSSDDAGKPTAKPTTAVDGKSKAAEMKAKAHGKSAEHKKTTTTE